MPDCSVNPDSAGSPSRWVGYVLPAAVFLLQFVVFTYLGLRRLIDSDEGFYLYISKLIVTNGAIPYRDVFYQQMPLLPYLYGLWMKAFGFSWGAGRSFSAFLAALTGTLIFRHVRKESQTIWLSLSAVILFSFNISALLFFLTAKTYVLSTLFLLGSLIVAVGGKGAGTGWRAGASGVLLACSIQTRLFFAAAVPVLAFWFWRLNAKEEHHKCFWGFLRGFALGLIPSLILFSIAPEQFVYDNLLYHGMRDPAGLVGDLFQKTQIARNLIVSISGFHPTQFFFLLCGLAFSFITWKRISEMGRLCAMVSVALGIASFLPTPTFGQYFCVLVPFLTICLVDSFRAFTGNLTGTRAQRLLLSGLVLFSIVYAAVSTPRIGSLFFRGEGIPGIGSDTNADDWDIQTVKMIADVIESNTTRGSLVVSSWPGYLLGVDRTIYPKMENQIAIDTSAKLSQEKADKFRMLREEELLSTIADPRVEAVVAGNCTRGRRPLYRRAADEGNYTLAAQIGSSEVFVRRQTRSNDD